MTDNCHVTGLSRPFDHHLMDPPDLEVLPGRIAEPAEIWLMPVLRRFLRGPSIVGLLHGGIGHVSWARRASQAATTERPANTAVLEIMVIGNLERDANRSLSITNASCHQRCSLTPHYVVSN